MKYSFIFCYRNREEHLNITIPRIKDYIIEHDLNAEIIIVEQADQGPFRRGNLLNLGVKIAHGDICVLHDIDYVPMNTVNYWDGESDVFFPAMRGHFVYNDLNEKKLEDIPGGYRHFKNDMSQHYGGVTSIKRDVMLAINGFDSKLIGWGRDDEILMQRIQNHSFKINRGDGDFMILDHPDTGAIANPKDLQNNSHRLYYWKDYAEDGINSEKAKFYEVRSKHPLVNTWIEATEFDGPTHIVFSNF